MSFNSSPIGSFTREIIGSWFMTALGALGYPAEDWPVGDLQKYVDASDLAEREIWLQLQQCDGTMW